MSSSTAVLVYHYETDRFGYGEVAIECPLEITTTGGITYDELGTYYSTYDDMPEIAYDSAFWNAATWVPAYFDTNHQVQYMTGEPGDCSLTSGLFGDAEQWSMLTRIRAHYQTNKEGDTDVALMTASYEDSRGDPLTSVAASPSTRDKFDVRTTGRWHQVKFAVNGNVEILGFTPTIVPEGDE